MSLIFATQLTAVATAALAVFAIVTAWYARGAFREQFQLLKLQRQQLDNQREADARQAEVLGLQADELRESLEERKREAKERRRAQASKVFIWQDHIRDGPMGAMTATAHAKNTSEQPVYELLLSWHDDDRPATRTQRQRPLMPGGEVSNDAEIPVGSEPDKFGVVATFRDVAGVHWEARPDGTFDEIPEGGVRVT